MTTYTVLGTCDNVNTCDACGKDNLKRTIALDTDGGVVYYGTDCAAHATGRKGSYLARKARATKVLTCESCGTCSKTVRYHGLTGQVTCPECDDRHSANLLCMTYAEFMKRS